ncbi:potassium channel family protein [Bacillus sp. mrc49]|uniref:potassium channel family protein n=1 Tax=Bacillus sp. mrc49 TaxID=2054913 RepID=UPI000C27F5C2|nr:potassium channel family protein [Bacillus sp. mrc49]PJN90364.1 ion transporter [Bacillus sp. mrc49]
MIRIGPFNTAVPRFPRFIRLLSIIALFLLSFGVLIHLVEPKNFPTLLDGIWWAIVTMSTVGYGDYTPVTNLGKIIGIILILSGVGLITSYFAQIAKMSISTEQLFLTGRKDFTGGGHFIIVGWNGRSKRIIQNIHERKHHQSIVLIDDTLQKHPLPRTNIHFVHGKATLDSVLKKANINQAIRVLITADLKQDELQTDMFSILTLLAVKGLNPEVYCLVEILTHEQKENALRAGADGIVETNKFASEYMQDCLSKGIVGEAKEQVEGDGLQIKQLPIQADWAEKTFKQLSTELLEQNILIIGILSGGETFIKPPADEIVHRNDVLLIIDD